MSKSLLQTVNQSQQSVPVIAAGGTPTILNLGTAVHGYGCNIQLSGNAIRLDGVGYYKVDASVLVVPSAVGTITLALYDDNDQIDGSIASVSVSTANNPVTVPVVATVRRGCNCNGAGSLTLRVINSVGGSVQNVSLRVEKS